MTLSKLIFQYCLYLKRVKMEAQVEEKEGIEVTEG